MAEAPGEPTFREILDALGAEVERVAARCRSLSLTRLAAPAEAGDSGPAMSAPSRAGLVRAAAQFLADAAAAVEGGTTAADLPSYRRLPVLPDAAVGDQLAVTGHDLLGAVVRLTGAETVRTPDGERRVAAIVRDAHGRLRALRRVL